MDNDTVSWDQAEPQDLLFWVERALRRYVEHPDCEECLGLAREGLERLRPGLVASGQHDAIPLCEELFRVTTALDEGHLRSSSEALALIGQSARVLSDLVGNAPPGLPPGRLLPLVNELRALRGVAALMMPAIVLASSRSPVAAIARQIPDAPEGSEPAPSAAGPEQEADPRPPRSDTDAPSRVDPPRAVPTALQDSGDGEPLPRSETPAASVASELLVDRERLEGAVLATGLLGAPAALLDELDLALRRLDQAFAQWRGAGAAPAGARDLADELHALRAPVRPVAPRFDEFAGMLEFLLLALADGERPVDPTAVQLVEDAIGVLPWLLQELRRGGPAETPLVDIVLRAGSLLAEEHELEENGPEEPWENSDETPEPWPDLTRMRSRGQAEMLRLAAAFDALERGAGSDRCRPDAAPDVAPEVVSDAALDAAPDDEGAAPVTICPDPAPGSPPDLKAVHEQVAQLADWQHQVVDALTRIATQAQALEAAIARLPSVPAEPASLDSSPGHAPGEPPSGTGGEPLAPSALQELQRLQQGLDMAVGDASATVLRQQRLTRMLQDSLREAWSEHGVVAGPQQGDQRPEPGGRP